MSKKNFSKYSAKGYYIALVLCAAAIGVSGYLYYRNGRETAADVPAAVQQQLQEKTPGVTQQPERDQQEKLPSQVTQATKPIAGKPAKTMSPVEGEEVAGFAMDCLSYNQTTRDWRTHGGCDLAAEAGTEVKAAADGEVYTVYEDDQMGMTVVLRHDGGYTTQYSSLAEKVPVQAGDRVKMGDVIGTVGSTALMENALGDHVCFRVTCDGEIIDPAEFLN